MLTPDFLLTYHLREGLVHRVQMTRDATLLPVVMLQWQLVSNGHRDVCTVNAFYNAHTETWALNDVRITHTHEAQVIQDTRLKPEGGVLRGTDLHGEPVEFQLDEIVLYTRTTPVSVQIPISLADAHWR